FLAEDGLLRAVSEVHVVLLLPRTLRRGLSRQGAGAASLQRHPPERRHPTPTPGDFPVDVRVIPAKTIDRNKLNRKRGGPRAASLRHSFRSSRATARASRPRARRPRWALRAGR